ncbi:MAG: ABC transporter permease [Candidatus Hydrogenedentota bacterium]
MIIPWDPQLIETVLRSLFVSGSATLLSLLVGVPFGAWLAIRDFRGKRIVVALLYTAMGFPTVAVGLLVMMLLWRSSPLGGLHWLYTVKAMILSQVIIASPVAAGLVHAAVDAVPKRIRLTALGLGVSRRMADYAVLREARIGLLVAAMAAFGSVISEVGSVMMVGGNIAGETRVMTTAIVQEARMGRFDTAVALSVILIGVSFLIHLGLTLLNWKKSPEWTS